MYIRGLIICFHYVKDKKMKKAKHLTFSLKECFKFKFISANEIKKSLKILDKSVKKNMKFCLLHFLIQIVYALSFLGRKLMIGSTTIFIDAFFLEEVSFGILAVGGIINNSMWNQLDNCPSSFFCT